MSPAIQCNHWPCGNRTSDSSGMCHLHRDPRSLAVTVAMEKATTSLSLTPLTSVHEEHILSDGTSHYADHCPGDSCSVHSGLRNLLDRVKSGELKLVLQPDPTPEPELIIEDQELPNGDTLFWNWPSGSNQDEVDLHARTAASRYTATRSGERTERGQVYVVTAQATDLSGYHDHSLVIVSDTAEAVAVIQQHALLTATQPELEATLRDARDQVAPRQSSGS